MESSPIGGYNNKLPSQLRCVSPKWNTTETITLEVSVNGQDYMGNYQLNVVDPLRVMKLSPMSGPIGGSTEIKLFGSGFTSSVPKDAEVLIKFGNLDRQALDKKGVTEINWNEESFYEGLKIPKNLMHGADEYDQKLGEGDAIK